MNYNKPILIVAIALGVGLGIEGLKKISALYRGGPAEAQTQSQKDFQIRPFQISGLNAEKSDLKPQNMNLNTRPSGRGMRLAQVSQPQIVSPEGVTKPESQKKKAETDSEKKKKKKTATELAKKKKKKEEKELKEKESKKLKELADREALEKELAHEREAQANKEKREELSATQTFLNETQPKAQPENPNDDGSIPIGYAEWAKLILNKPNPEGVNKLVKFFQGGLVSGDIFYNILNAMMSEQNNEQHLLSVAAARQTPNPRSFIFLVDVMKNDGDAKIQAESNAALNDYVKVELVANLRAVLSSQIRNTSTLSIALDLLDKSTNQYIEGRVPAEASPTNTTSSSPKSYARVYRGFKSILEKIVQSYDSSSAIQALAQRSLTRIQSI